MRSRPEQFSRPHPLTFDVLDNTLLARGFTAPTGRALPTGVRLVAAGACIVLAFSLWGITQILRGPDIGVGAELEASMRRHPAGRDLR